MIKLDPLEGADDIAEIVFLAVDEARRRHGVGRELATAVERELLFRGTRRVMAKVNVSNTSATRFWIAQGYQFEARLNGMHPGWDYYLLFKTLR